MLKIIRYIIGFSLFAAALYYAGPSSILENLSRVDIPMLLLLTFGTLLAFIVSSLGTTTLARAKCPSITWKEGVESVLATSSIGLIAPGRLGDLALTYYWKEHLTYEQSISVIILDKMITLAALVAAAAYGFVR